MDKIIEDFVPATAAAAKSHPHVRMLSVHREVVLRLGIVAAWQAKQLVLGRLSEKHAVRFSGGTAQSQALRVPEISKSHLVNLHIYELKILTSALGTCSRIRVRDLTAEPCFLVLNDQGSQNDSRFEISSDCVVIGG